MISSVSGRGLSTVDLELRLGISAATTFNDHACAGASSGLHSPAAFPSYKLGLGLGLGLGFEDWEQTNKAGEIITMLSEEEVELQEWQEKLNIAEKNLEEMKEDYKVLYERRKCIGFNHELDKFIKREVIAIERIRRYLCLPICTPEMRKQALGALSSYRRVLNKLGYLKSMGYTTYMAKRDFFLDYFRSFENKQG